MQLPSLSHSYSLKTWRSESLFGEGTHAHAHTHALNMRIQNYHLNKQKKRQNGLLCFIHLGKQQKKKKNCAGISLTQTIHLTSVTLAAVIHTHSQKNIHFYNYPHLFDFFVVFVISFFRQVQIFKFFL